MTVDWDGQIRMDPSSPYAMQRVIDIKDHFDITWACDTDHDRHGIVTRSSACCPPTITFRWPSSTFFNIGPNGARKLPSEKQW